MADLLERVNASIDSVKAVVAQASAAGVDPALVDAWKDDFDALKLVPDSFEARIGFIGRTGVGKSQALNAILGERRLFPVAGSKSCTATVIEAKYHSDANYKADFQFITKDDWNSTVKELISSLFPDPRLSHEQERARLNENEQHLARTTVKDILQALLGEPVTNDQISRKEDVTRLFNQATNRHESLLNGESLPTIIEDNKNDFYNAVCPYVTGGDNGVESLWPLVSVCSMYHNWELLKNGIILVDLPGTGDANNVRGKVAERYLQECHALFVVADSVRAADDREARELGFRLHRELGRELQLDGKLNSVSFMITKIDQYQTQELLEEEGRLNEWRALDERLSELEEAEDQLGENITQEVLEDLKTIKEEMRAIEMTCLRSRNERLVQMVREKYREQVRELRRGRMGELPDVNVFCTSAVRALAPRDRNTGIRWVAEDTGIPQLKSHLRDFAVNQTKRLAGKNLGSVIHRVATFAMVIKSTFGTENRTFRSNYTKEILGNSVLKLVQKEIDDWNRDLWREIEKHKLITELKRGADQAKRCAVETQSEWRYKLMWNTYKAAMERHGDFYSSGQWDQIKMNKALVNPILEAMGGDWEEIFELIRDLNGKLIEKIKSQLSDWEEHEEQESTNQGGAAEGIDTEEAHYIRSTTRRFVTSRTMSIIQEEIENHVQWTSRNQSEGWRKIEPHIKTSLSNGYSTAATESGSGMFDRMHYTMIDEIRSKEDMFHHSIKHPINELNELVSRVKDGVNGALRRLEQRILMEDSSSTLQTRNAKDCVPLLSAWKEEANKIIEITDDFKLEVNRESKRQLIIEVIRVRDFLKTEDLTSQMEDLGLNDESHNNHCVICLDGTPIWVAVHGNKSHKILCDSCKNQMEQRASQPIECPVCRQRVERFTTVVEV